MTTNNHPANGPVSLDRLHQISEILSKASAQSDGGNLGCAMADAVKVIDGAIAAFDAKPVAWLADASKEHISLVRYLDKQMFNGNQEWLKEAIENTEAKPLYTAPPAPVVPPAQNWEELCRKYPGMSIGDAIIRAAGWNLCRYTMLQGKSEPANQNDEFPLDYLQGQKDGLEWAAQLAEANHPQTSDWLYDDPIELARAIRKGPDMPTSQAGNYPVVPSATAFISEFDRLIGERDNEIESGQLGVANFSALLNAASDAFVTVNGNSPVTPDGWIPVSERMPEAHEPIYIFHPDYGVDEGVWYDNQEDAFLWDSDCSRCRAIETVSHWMPMPALPAAPQQEVK